MAGMRTREGLIGAYAQGNIGCMLELNCETDFVARSDAMQKLLSDVSTYVAS